MITLYRIIDPRFPQETRYYGITTSSISKRLSEHLRLARLGKKFPLLDWIRKIQQEGQDPQIEAVAVFNTRIDANLAEKEHIAKGRALGYKLLATECWSCITT